MSASQRKISANRKNSRHSTGPRTQTGKNRSSQNSWRHGLSITLPSMVQLSPKAKHLANAIAGPNSDPVRLHFATIAVEAELELLRVPSIRNSLLASTMGGDATVSDFQQAAETIPKIVHDLCRLERYERRAFSRRNRALQLL